MRCGRIPGGRTYDRCNVLTWNKPGHVELIDADECPDGFMPVDKGEMPVPGPGEILWFDYNVVAGRLKKTYFCAPMPRRWSSLSIKRALEGIGVWESAKSFMLAKDMYEEFLMADYIEEGDPSFNTVFPALVAAFGEDEVNRILDSMPTV